MINITSPRFVSYLITQFLVAFDDNAYKFIISIMAANTAVHQDNGTFLLSLTGIVFILPYLLFSGWAGHLADTLAKRSIMIYMKFIEIIIMILALLAFMQSNLYYMLFILFLLTTQSAFFSPAKYGILPEMFELTHLSKANGWQELTLFLAIILGTVFGGILWSFAADTPEFAGLVLIVCAVLGTVFSFFIPKTTNIMPYKKFYKNPWTEIILGAKTLWTEKPLLHCVMLTSYFWFLGSLLQMIILLMGKERLSVSDLQISLLNASTAIGIGVGSLFAGYLSHKQIRRDFIPYAAIAMALMGTLFALSTQFIWAIITLSLLGLAAGFYIVPLQTYLQHQAPKASRGRLIATNNFINMLGVFFASLTLWILRDFITLPAHYILVLFSGITLLIALYVLRYLPTK